MNNIKKYFDVVHEYLDRIDSECGEEIIEASHMLAECFDNNGIGQLFGLKHGLEFAMELGYRAGGLMPFHKMNLGDLLLRGKITEEQLNDEAIYDNLEIAHMLVENYNTYPEDMYIIVSSGGYEAVAVEVALMAKEAGQKVIAVVNMNEVRQATSHHPSGKLLTDVADLVIDTLAPYPDVTVEVAGEQMCPIGTINGNIIAQMITGETYNYFVSQGKECPILLSANVKGADVYNRKISDKYVGRWNSI